MSSQPNPPSSFTVLISAEAVQHISSKHLSDRYERALWGEFVKSAADLVTLLPSEIQRSLEHPLFVEYEQYDPNGVFLHKARECVLRRYHRRPSCRGRHDREPDYRLLPLRNL